MSQPSSRSGHHKVVIVGGGTGGIFVAARLRRAGLPAMYWNLMVMGRP